LSDKIKGNILLLLTAIVWGSGFIAQKAGGMMPPLTYNGIRNILASLVLLPLIWVFSRRRETQNKNNASPFHFDRATLKAGLACGVALCVSTNLQQMGIYLFMDAGKAGFITSLYIVFVPLLSLIFFRKKVRLAVWGCILLAAFGFYLLTMAGKPAGLSLLPNDIFVLLCAVGFACHIIIADHFLPGTDGVKVACLQFFVTGVLSLLAIPWEQPTLECIIACTIPLLYASVISSGVGYTCQLLGQQYADPTVASLLMSLESVFAAIFGALIYNERLSSTELLGCAVIFVAVAIPQLLQKQK